MKAVVEYESSPRVADRVFDIPHADPVPIFADASGRVGTDPTELAGPDRTIDEAAVSSVLQFGAIVPPLSPWKNVRRLEPGFRYHGATRLEPIPVERPSGIRDLDVEQQADEIERLLDRQLKRAIGDGPDPVVLFSGGVDSGLMASRLAQMGHTETILIHHSFGSDDAESHLAEEMARRLGLRFEQLHASHAHHRILENPADLYVQPVANRSTVATLELAYEVVERFAGQRRSILDGMGADGGFGLLARVRSWERLLRIPRPIRVAAAQLYRHDLWSRNSEFEHLMRAIRRSATMPPLAAVHAQNPLQGIFYESGYTAAVSDLLAEWTDGWGGDSFAEQAVAADLAFCCGNVYIPRSHSVYARAGLDVHYPFLTTEMIGVALTAYGHWDSSEQKAPLKRSLARQLPPEMVYRRKNAYGDPAMRVFKSEQFIGYLRDAAEPSSPLASMLRPRPIVKACGLLSKGVDLPLQTLAGLWAIALTDRWYRTVGQADS